MKVSCTLRLALLLAIGLCVPLPAIAQRQPLVREPTVTVLESDATHLRLTVAFETPTLIPVQRAGVAYTEVRVPGVPVEVGTPGSPAVPVFRRLIAVPPGAQVAVNATTQVANQLSLNLVPFQPQPVDQIPPLELPPLPQVFADLPFRLNQRLYALDRLYPSEVASVRLLGRSRDQQVAQLEIAAGQYNPVRKRYTAFSSVDVEVSFIQGPLGFVPIRALSTIDKASSLTISSMLNSTAVIGNTLPSTLVPANIGSEYLILTHPSLRAAADKLAEWRRQDGTSVAVVDVNDGGGSGPDTSSQIKAYIDHQYDVSMIRPSYVLLMGSTNLVGTFYVSTGGSATTGTDYPYAVYGPNSAGAPPSYAVGRIPARTLNEANTIVDKIIKYEKTPPVGLDFYRSAAIAAQFQYDRSDVGERGWDQRTFIEVAEFCRNVLINNGKTAQRIYINTGSGTPRKYCDGTPLPADLGPGSGFPWNGSTTDIINAFNAGHFLIIHRDHGWPDGWVNPSFSTSNLTSVHNGDLLPVVFSVNCASGFFDAPTANGDYGTSASQTYFAERILARTDGGAVGVLGDTRNSPSWPNSALLRGFMDAIYPDAIPTFGDSTPRRRLGDILNHGKLYLLTQVGAAGIGGYDVQDELYLWHVLGDPMMKLRLSPPPLRISPVALTSVRLGIQAITALFSNADGATVTAFQETDQGTITIGEGTVVNGTAQIPYGVTPVAGVPIQFAVQAPDATSVRLAPTTPLLSPLMLSDLVLSAAAVAGGASVTGTVTLNAPASGRGTLIALKSSNSLVATVPDSLLIPAGSTKGSFTISTKIVRAPSAVTITATLGDDSLSTNLTVGLLLANRDRSITVKAGSGRAGDAIPITILTSSALTGYTRALLSVEFPPELGDVIVPEGATSGVVTMPDPVLPGARVSFSAGDGRFTVQMSSSAPAATGGRLAEFVLTTDPDAPAGSYPIRLTVAQLNDATGQQVPCTTVDGMLVLSAGFPKGDLNKSGKVDVADAVIALRVSVGLQEPTPEQLALGDVTGDGRIDLGDASRILGIAIGLVKPILPIIRPPITGTLVPVTLL